MKRVTTMTVITIGLTVLMFQGVAEGAMLQKGSRGEQVDHLQHQLSRMNYLHTPSTGYFGQATRRAVRQFQTDFHLRSDGVAGPSTQHQLTSAKKMAKMVHGEARGESDQGKVAVAAVIRNRIRSNQFPSTVNGVLFQTNAFTAAKDGQYNQAPGARDYKAIKTAWAGKDPTGGATYFYNPKIATSEWIGTRTPIGTIGKHVFAK